MSPAGTDERLRTTPVRHAMTSEIVTCTADVPLSEVADLMTEHRIHSVVVLAPPADAGPEDDRWEWSVLADVDLVAAACWSDDVAGAGTVAASPRVTVRPDDTLAEAALAMSEYAVAHVLVVEPGAGTPAGILSALDIARALRAEPAEPAPRPRTSAAPVRAGDRLVIAPHHQGGRARDAEVLEARGADGGPPYLVRWQDTGRVTLHYPGSDAQIEHLSRA